MYQDPIIIIHERHVIGFFPSQQIILGIREISHTRHAVNYLIPQTRQIIDPCKHSEIVRYYLDNEPGTPHHTINTDLRSWIAAHDENGKPELFTRLTIELARVLETAREAFKDIEA